MVATWTKSEKETWLDSAQAKDQHQQVKKTILLADDVRLCRELGKTFLRRTRAEILLAEDGAQALDIAKRHRPDLIILDYQMPRMRGDEVCRRLKQDPGLQHIPVVMLSIEGDHETMRQCMKAGCDDYLTKPIHQNVLLEKTSELLDLPSRRGLRVLVEFHIGQPTEEEFNLGYSVDINRTGMFLETDANLECGERVNLNFFLPRHEEKIETTAEVVRSLDDEGKSGYGLRFLFLDQETRRAISDYAESQWDPTRATATEKANP